jgi:hypothetical protein
MKKYCNERQFNAELTDLDFLWSTPPSSCNHASLLVSPATKLPEVCPPAAGLQSRPVIPCHYVRARAENRASMYEEEKGANHRR